MKLIPKLRVSLICGSLKTGFECTCYPLTDYLHDLFTEPTHSETAPTTPCPRRSRHLLHLRPGDFLQFSARVFGASQSRSFPRRIRLSGLSIRLEDRRGEKKSPQNSYHRSLRQNALPISAGKMSGEKDSEISSHIGNELQCGERHFLRQLFFRVEV